LGVFGVEPNAVGCRAASSYPVWSKKSSGADSGSQGIALTYCERTASFATIATASSSPGDYPITPIFSDPNARLANYTVTTNLGTLTVDGVAMSVSTVGGSSTFCWPTNAGAFLLECADNLTAPVTLQAITSGMVTNNASICYTVTPQATNPSRFYRLHLP
jgi:hypothetical protein